MNVYRREPIIPNKISFGFTIWYMFVSPRVDISLGETKINHVDFRLLGMEAGYAVPKLNVAVKETTVMHELQPGYLE